MIGWSLPVEGSAEAARLAFFLALLSAVAHAAFGALQKGRHDPWLARGAMDVFMTAMALPVALFVAPAPSMALVAVLAGAFCIHTCYKYVLAMAYTRAAYTVVYPVVRGIGPLATVLAAGAVFGERFAPLQWAGVLLLSGAIFALAAYNLRRTRVGRARLVSALALAIVTGLFVATYTTYDAYGIRLAEHPLTFLAWFFVIDGLVFPVIAWRRRRRMVDPPALGPLFLRGVAGALTAFVSFGAVMMATRLDKVGEAASLRETSTIFAALFGWLLLREEVGWLRAGLMALVALGAIAVEFGG
ncbi:MAG: multidrug transporter [Alphaproteobacteria bacterium]|nr:MAG: multidrug transporter [Alphaproteobacteria bacterium]